MLMTLQRTRPDLIRCSPVSACSLHLDAGDVAEFDRANALIASLLPVIEKADAKAKDACTISAELLRNLKEFASQVRARPPSEFKKPEEEYILSTSLAPCLTHVQETANEAIAILEAPERETLKLKARANRVLRIIAYYSVGLLFLLSCMGQSIFRPFLGSVLVFFGVGAYYSRCEYSTSLTAKEQKLSLLNFEFSAEGKEEGAHEG